MNETIVHSLQVVLFLMVLGAWLSLVWGGVRAYLSNKPEYVKNRTFLVKTFWMLCASSFLFFSVGVSRYFMEFPSWGWFVMAFGIAILECYPMNNSIKELSKK